MSDSQVLFIAIMICVAMMYCAGIIVALLVRPKDPPPNYDERQKIVQGKANGYAYYTLLLSLGAYLLYDWIAEKPVLNAPIGVIMCIIVSLAVYSVTCIIKEAYDTLSGQGSPGLWYYVIMSACFVWQGVRSIVDGSIIKDGVLQFPAVILVSGVCYAVIGAAFLIRFIIRKKQAAQETGEDE